MVLRNNRAVTCFNASRDFRMIMTGDNQLIAITPTSGEGGFRMHFFYSNSFVCPLRCWMLFAKP